MRGSMRSPVMRLRRWRAFGDDGAVDDLVDDVLEAAGGCAVEDFIDKAEEVLLRRRRGARRVSCRR